MVDRMRRRVIELSDGRIVRDEASGLYAQDEQTTAEFGALLTPRGARPTRPMRLGFFLREALRSMKRNAVPSLRRDGLGARHGARARRLHPDRPGDDRRGQRGARAGPRQRLPQDRREARRRRARRAAPEERHAVRRHASSSSPRSRRTRRRRSATPRPTSCWAPTRCPTPSASRRTSPTTSRSCATRSRRSRPAAGARRSTRRSTRSRTAATTRRRSSPPRAW